VIPNSKASFHTNSYHRISSRSAFDLPLDVISLAEEGEPVIEDLLLAITEILPVWAAFLGVQR
jgi:hypothetical protein